MGAVRASDVSPQSKPPNRAAQSCRLRLKRTRTRQHQPSFAAPDRRRRRRNLVRSGVRAASWEVSRLGARPRVSDQADREEMPQPRGRCASATLASLAWPSPQCRQRAEASDKQLAQSHAPPSDRLVADSRDARLWGASGTVMRVRVRVDGNAHERTQSARRASTAQTGSSGAAQVRVGSPPAAAPPVLDDTDGRSQDRMDTTFSPPLASWSRLRIARIESRQRGGTMRIRPK